MTTYDSAIAKLASAANAGWKLDLSRIRCLVDRLRIERHPGYFHVAGTNGKGSTTAYIHRLLDLHGYRVGAFYSPFVYTLRERIQLGGRYVTESELTRLVEHVWKAGEECDRNGLGLPTEFEIKTAMGLQFWSESQCDYVALEVGLGGRLDATNVIDKPSASIITSISMDHTEILGDSLGAIAAEKAGIIKRHRPVVVGRIGEEPEHVIAEIARKMDAPVFRLGKEVIVEGDGSMFDCNVLGKTYRSIRTGMPGAEQQDSASLALAAIAIAGIDLDKETVREAIRGTRLPGRGEIVFHASKRWYLDGSHNPAGIRSLVSRMRNESDTKPFLLMGMAKGHDHVAVIAALADVVDDCIFVPLDSPRSQKPEDLAAVAKEHGLKVRVLADATEAVNMLKADPTELILVTGSYYLVGEVGSLIGSVFSRL
ncbi:MAG: bifunctional folylpolyglutamate synthase/dihydrofolate synthase [Fimbriimonadaceae bacterium]|nr:bifunctional folylpolyglutamate synthase/dihydrofolate synthase [Fimbriimonadaceae bacterium]QYK55608.1 MAG: bifunctional folylpolyglutamate synthase/dihydrofolate synthase [Fimbriimonadaceae bacterium]